MLTYYRHRPCPIAGCKRHRKRFHVMCPEHWAMVPGSIQDLVYETERNERGSKEHAAAIVAAIRAVRRVVFQRG